MPYSDGVNTRIIALATRAHASSARSFRCIRNSASRPSAYRSAAWCTIKATARTSISTPSAQTTAPFLGEVKARGNGEGFATLESRLGDSDLLFLRRDRAEPVIVLPWRIWARLLSATARNPLASALASLSSASLRPAAGAVVTHNGREIGLTPSPPLLDPGRAREGRQRADRGGAPEN
jgi:hypothetical protein